MGAKVYCQHQHSDTTLSIRMSVLSFLNVLPFYANTNSSLQITTNRKSCQKVIVFNMLTPFAKMSVSIRYASSAGPSKFDKSCASFTRVWFPFSVLNIYPSFSIIHNCTIVPDPYMTAIIASIFQACTFLFSLYQTNPEFFAKANNKY